jgi:Protein of unknown function (DUF2892)
MWLVNFLNSIPGRIAKVVLGVWLLVQGTSLGTLGGLIMMMAGIVLAITGLAGYCIVEELVKGWKSGHGDTPHARGHRA